MAFRILTILCLLATLPQFATAQCDAAKYNFILKEADALREQGQFILAKNNYEAAIQFACTPREKEYLEAQVDDLFKQIEELRVEAERAKERADSTATAAQRAARRAYANDLAYKSQIALERGDRTTAFRLAEFAHRYVDNDNLQVTRAHVDALYYNDKPDPTRPPRPWASNLEGHTSLIESAAFSPNGSRLATGSWDNTAKIWDLASGQAALTLEGHTDAVSSVAFSPDGTRLATASDDGTAKIWDLSSGKAALALEGHTDAVSSVAFSPDGSRLATGSDDGTAKIWDLSSGKTVLTLQGHTSYVSSVAFSPDGTHLATGSYDDTAKIWDLASGQAALTLEGHTSFVTSVAFSPDGTRLATGSWDNTAKIWDLASGKAALTLEGYTSSVSSVAFSPDGTRLATGSWDNTAKIWDLASGQAALTLEGHTSFVTSVAFSPDGTHLATGSYDDTAKIWDLASGQAALTLEGHTSFVTSVAFSPDGTRLATGSWDNTAKIWDLASGKALLALEGHTSDVSSVAFSPDGTRLATGSYDKTAKIWDLSSGKAALILEGHTSMIESVAFSRDGTRLVTGSWDNTAKIWDLASGQAALTLEGHTSFVTSVAFSPDGTRLATGSWDNTAKIWDLASGKAALTLEGHTSSVSSVAFSPDGTRLATGSDDNTAKIWDLASGKASLTLEGHSDGVSSVAFSPACPDDPIGGTRLATGSDDWTAKIWDWASGKATLTLEGHTDAVWSVAFSPACPDDPIGGTRLATGSKEHTVKLWEITPQGLGVVGRERRLAGLISAQLTEYGLEDLLDQLPDNDDMLIATGEVWQIKAFADLHAKEAAGSNILESVNPQYARAERLYAAALALQDEPLIRQDYSEMLRSWAAVYRSEGRMTEEREQLEKAQRLWHDEAGLDRLLAIGEAMGEPIDFDRFLASEDPRELRDYGDFFYKKEEWNEAKQLYEKAEGKTHSSAVLKNLFSIAEAMGEEFDFARFLTSEDPRELRGYGDFFYEKEEWNEAKQLYEKAEGKTHSSAVLKNLFSIAESMGEEFDFDRFWASEDPGELRGYGDFFYEKEQWNEAKQLYEKAEAKEHSAAVSKNLISIAEAMGEEFDFDRFLASENSRELRGYGDFFYEKEQWNEAEQLYEKAEAKEHSAAVLKNLFSIAEAMGEGFDFDRFLASEDPRELRDYGYFFYEKEKWNEVKQLYEKAEGKAHDAQNLIIIHFISETGNLPFDFEQFLSSDSAEDLEQYGDYFIERAEKESTFAARIPDYQNALRIRERQMEVDRSAALRRRVASEYNNLGYCQLIQPDGLGAEQSCRRALELDPENKYSHSKLPVALLLQGKTAEAKAYYLAWEDKPFREQGRATYTYRDAYLDDLAALEAAGVKEIDYAMVRQWLTE